MTVFCVLYCTFSNRSALDRGKWSMVWSVQAGGMDRLSRTKSHRAGSLSWRAAVMGQPSSLRPHWSVAPRDDAAEGVVQRVDPAVCFTCIQLWTENGEGGVVCVHSHKNQMVCSLVKKNKLPFVGNKSRPTIRERTWRYKSGIFVRQICIYSFLKKR